MGLIKEPNNVDLIIKGKSLTKKEEKIISDFIKRRKLEMFQKNNRKTNFLRHYKKISA